MLRVCTAWWPATPAHTKAFPSTVHPLITVLRGGLIHLTRHLAAYWAKYSIRVNAISPGAFPRAEQRRTLTELISRLEEKVPMNRMGDPEELKGVVLLLASDAGSYITGQNLLVDGGWTAW